MNESEKETIQREVDMLCEEAGRREKEIGPKAWKNAMVMLKSYMNTGKSNFHAGVMKLPVSSKHVFITVGDRIYRWSELTPEDKTRFLEKDLFAWTGVPRTAGAEVVPLSTLTIFEESDGTTDTRRD